MSDHTIKAAAPQPQPFVTASRPSDRAPKLSGHMNAVTLAIAVLAFSAPLVTVTGYLPPAIVSGGQGATFAFVLTTVVLLLFAVGYVTLVRHLPVVGGFYAFISAGLGLGGGPNTPVRCRHSAS